MNRCLVQLDISTVKSIYQIYPPPKTPKQVHSEARIYLADPYREHNQTTFIVVAQAMVATNPNPCAKHDCPLNEAGISHSEGIYKHEGKDAGS